MQRRERLGCVAAEAQPTSRGENDRGRRGTGSDRLERAPHEHLREMRAVLGRRVEVGRRLGADGGFARAASAADAPCVSAFSTAVARSGVEPMLTSATWVPPFTRAATAPTIAQSWARRLNFSYAKPAAPLLRHLDLGEQLVGRERGLEEALEEVGRRDRARRRPGPATRTSRRARAAPRAGRSRGRRARPNRRSCRGGGPGCRRPAPRPRATRRTPCASTRSSRGRGAG